MDYDISAVQEVLGEAALSYWGKGVLVTTEYPNPFPATLSGVLLGGTVGNGIGYDPNGQLTRIDSSSTTAKTFTLAAAHATLPRWDLVCIKYKMTGTVPVPKPSDPITSVFLNLVDDFELVVVTGTPGVTPAYPAKAAGSIVLFGVKIPPTATLGTSCVVDYFPRERAMANVVGAPDFVQEVPAGTVDGSNAAFTLSRDPLTNQSLLVFLDELALSSDEWSIVNRVVTLATPPALGQSVMAYYIANSASSLNPLSGAQEVPSGTVDGSNDLFSLTGKAANQGSTLVFVDGLAVDASDWNLVQAINSSKIQFNSGAIPAPGQSVYVWYLTNATSVGSGASQTGKTQTFTLSPTDITNGFVNLAHNPADASSVVLDVIGGSAQEFGSDFTVSGAQLSWTGLGLDGVLVAGSKLRVFYLY